MNRTTLGALVDDAARSLQLAGVAPHGRPGRARLATRSVAQYRTEASELSAFVLGLPCGDLPMDRVLTDNETELITTLVRRRAEGVPIGYLTGVAVVGGVQVSVGHGVFVPRPETELLLAHGLRAIEGVPDPLVVDLCTGSGAVALAIAHARPDATVHAVEIDPLAIEFAVRNSAARVARGDTAIVVHEADVAQPGLLSDLDGNVDLLIALPPFMRDGDESWLVSEFSEHQPAKAIFGGPDGLGVCRSVVAVAFRLLRPGALCIIEHGPLHGDVLPEMLAAGGRFVDISDHKDQDDWPLYAAATRTSDPSIR
jgi:release factor glutamine methyltransferase